MAWQQEAKSERLMVTRLTRPVWPLWTLPKIAKHLCKVLIFAVLRGEHHWPFKSYLGHRLVIKFSGPVWPKCRHVRFITWRCKAADILICLHSSENGENAESCTPSNQMNENVSCKTNVIVLEKSCPLVRQALISGMLLYNLACFPCLIAITERTLSPSSLI